MWDRDKSDNLQLVSDYIEIHRSTLLAPDVELHIAGYDSALAGQEAVWDFLKHLYVSYGVTLGVENTIENITPLSESVFMVEYNYQGTAFSGDI